MAFIGEHDFIEPREKYETQEQLFQWLRHLYAYSYVNSFLTKQDLVLEIGCGTGYGTKETAESVSKVTAIDIWVKGIKYCEKKFGNQINFILSTGTNLPFRHNSFDAVISMQVIEHISPNFIPNYLSEIHQALTPNGRFFVSTPNKKIRLLPFQKPRNPNHTIEFDPNSLRICLKQKFKFVKIVGLFARRELYMIEYNRVKQNPVSALFRLLINLSQFLLPTFIRRFLSSALPKKKPKLHLEKKSTINKNQFSLKEFSTSDKRLQSCIDIYGICSKINE